jgi:RNase H-fold protein (predicted Holliday junction resolvase)
MAKLLALDVSTKTIGLALFETNGKLLELTHITPKIKPQPKNKLEEMFKKVDAFNDVISRYMDLDIEHVVIEEPLLGSNNIFTVGTLLKFNGMISKAVGDVLKIVPEFITSYDARALAFPDLLQIRQYDKKGKKYSDNDIKKKSPVLFGGYPFDIDKKQVIWQKVSDLEPQIVWVYDKHQKLKKESFDMSDAYACGYGWLRKSGFIK